MTSLLRIPSRTRFAWSRRWPRQALVPSSRPLSLHADPVSAWEGQSNTNTNATTTNSVGPAPNKLRFPHPFEPASHPVGVTAAVLHAKSPSSSSPSSSSPSPGSSGSSTGTPTQARPTIFSEFSLSDRVALVSGANRGLGLEMALAMCEAGARAVYCLDLPETPSDEWTVAERYVRDMKTNGGEGGGGGRLEYVSCDVTNQKRMWEVGEQVAEREGRLDVCVAAAGVPATHMDCLSYPEEQVRKVLDVNTCGALFAAQAAGRQMIRMEKPGSIILIASMSGSITNRGHAWVPYNASKAAVIQMARSLACELGKHGIRVNSLSPGHVYTNMSAAELDTQPELLDQWSNLNPLGRIGRPDEMRGAVVWLASDASSFCTGSDIIVAGGHQAW